jgi:hypothetical protein
LLIKISRWINRSPEYSGHFFRVRSFHVPADSSH